MLPVSNLDDLLERFDLTESGVVSFVTFPKK